MNRCMSCDTEIVLLPSGFSCMKVDAGSFCMKCASLAEALHMRATGCAMLYETDPWAGQGSYVSDFAGGLRFAITSRRKSRHNIARVRTDVWFRDMDGAMWHGMRCGDNGTYLRCKRTKGTK